MVEDALKMMVLVKVHSLTQSALAQEDLMEAMEVRVTQFKDKMDKALIVVKIDQLHTSTGLLKVSMKVVEVVQPLSKAGSNNKT